MFASIPKTLANQLKGLQSSSIVHGYKINRIKEFPVFNYVAVELTHLKTNAQHLHVIKDDSNNVFNVSFQTAPGDSTGVPHILEHVTLCGSQKYPVRDPFFKMLNRSVSTFMNAMTGSDFTMYPFSSENSEDYFNLMDVYFDSVFHPRLRKTDFYQEGWRLEHEDPKDAKSKIVYKGVVYNEMKGAFSDVGYLFCARQQQAMYPGTTYGHVSGGDPKNIVDLTHEQLVAFHRANYHPSNGRFFTYGNIPMEKQLSTLNKYLNQFEPAAKSKAITPLVPFKSEKTFNARFAPDPAMPLETQNKVALNFLTNNEENVLENLTIQLFTSLLIGGVSTPMYKALIESGLGSEYASSSGHDTTSSQTNVSIGLQGVSSKDVDKVKQTIVDTLQVVSKEGFKAEHVDGVIHQLELSAKHVRSNFGMMMCQSIAAPWTHNVDVFELLDYTKHLDQLKANFKNVNFVKSIVEKYFTSNPHKLTFIMTPDVDYNKKLEAEEAESLKSRVDSLSEKSKQEIYETGIELSKLQDAKEDLSCLPCIKIADLSKSPRHFPVDITKDPIYLQTRKTGTNGVTYYSIEKSLNNLPLELVDYIPLYTQTLSKMGTKKTSYIEMDQKLKLHSGGISVSLSTNTLTNDLCSENSSLSFSSYFIGTETGEHSKVLFELMQEMIEMPAWDNIPRLKTILTEVNSSQMNHLAGSGHNLAISASSKRFSPSLFKNDAWFGLGSISYLNRLMTTKNETDETLLDIANKMKAISEFLKNSTYNRSVINGSNLKECEDQIKQFSTKMNWITCPPQCQPQSFEMKLVTGNLFEGYKVPFPVNYVSKSFSTVPYLHEDSVPLQVLASLLGSQYLHKEIREKGGAYGGGARHSAQDGYFSFWSYRDPNVDRTLEVYENAIKQQFSSLRELDEAKLSIFKNIDLPVSPSQEGRLFFKTGITLEMQQARRDRLFACTLAEVERVKNTYLANKPFAVAVLGELKEERVGWNISQI